MINQPFLHNVTLADYSINKNQMLLKPGSCYGIYNNSLLKHICSAALSEQMLHFSFRAKIDINYWSTEIYYLVCLQDPTDDTMRQQ